MEIHRFHAAGILKFKIKKERIFNAIIDLLAKKIGLFYAQNTLYTDLSRFFFERGLSGT
jgi:hypothetical protein